MAKRFRTLTKSIAPRWLTEGEGELVQYSLDLMMDAFVERVRLGLMARLPQNDPTGETTATPDALAAMGRDRRVVRGLSEDAPGYAIRLIRWLDDRRRAGNPFALMQKLAEYTGPLCAFRTVDASSNWFSRAADGSETYALKRANWDWDGKPRDVAGKLRWSRFWVVIYPNGLWTPTGNAWGDAGAQHWGAPGHTWGSTATPEQVATVRAIVDDWKPAGTRCVNVILAFDGASFDPAAAIDAAGMPHGAWEHWSHNVGGVQVRARLDTARYWDGS